MSTVNSRVKVPSQDSFTDIAKIDGTKAQITNGRKFTWLKVRKDAVLNIVKKPAGYLGMLAVDIVGLALSIIGAVGTFLLMALTLGQNKKVRKAFISCCKGVRATAIGVIALPAIMLGSIATGVIGLFCPQVPGNYNDMIHDFFEEE